MNFLAHLYLTREQPDLISVGNFMADAVKGSKVLDTYPELIREGIIIHRNIDSYTDTHPIFREGCARLRPHYGKFAPVIMDVFYDHFLAQNWSDYSEQSLKDFSKSRYKLLTANKDHLPDQSKQWLRYIKIENLLYAYASESKIEQVLRRMDNRTGGVSGMTGAIRELRLYRNSFESEFRLFMNEILIYIAGELRSMK
jgi:acyl carrier protein phosphodiesterase